MGKRKEGTGDKGGLGGRRGMTPQSAATLHVPVGEGDG